MTLLDFLEHHHQTYAAFGQSIGVSSEAVRRYATEGRVPTPEVMRKIIEVTSGAVRPDDFFGLEPKKCDCQKEEAH